MLARAGARLNSRAHSVVLSRGAGQAELLAALRKSQWHAAHGGGAAGRGWGAAGRSSPTDTAPPSSRASRQHARWIERVERSLEERSLQQGRQAAGLPQQGGQGGQGGQGAREAKRSSGGQGGQGGRRAGFGGGDADLRVNRAHEHLDLHKF